jgi:hypothetical protein
VNIWGKLFEVIGCKTSKSFPQIFKKMIKSSKELKNEINLRKLQNRFKINPK